MHTRQHTRAPAPFQLSLRSLVIQGRGFAFRCHAQGRVDVRTELRPGCAALALAAAALAAGCSSMHYPVNAPLGSDRQASGYTLRNLKSPDNSDSLLVFASFSGGGYRAAAMAFAVMEVLSQTPIQWDGQARTLLQELDLISAVSGGSLAAAAFALGPEQFIASFRSTVLDFDLQAALLSRVLSPAGLWHQTSSTYGRGDLLQALLDERFFSGMTYAALPRRRPMVSINATDLRYGERFEFSQDQFDQICSDLDAFPVARAVAASMAVPLIMSPVTLWNHNPTCRTRPEPALPYSRAALSQYVHLVDGGLADNTGVHALLQGVARHGGLVRAGKAYGLRGVRKRIFIVVNAQVDGPQAEDQSPHTPGLLRQLRSAVEVPVSRHTDSSLKLLDEAVRQWQVDARQPLPLEPGTFRIIEISMARARDAALGAAVQDIPTGLAIRPSQIELVRSFVRRELELNPEWQALMRELQGGAVAGGSGAEVGTVSDGQHQQQADGH